MSTVNEARHESVNAAAQNEVGLRELAAWHAGRAKNRAFFRMGQHWLLYSRPSRSTLAHWARLAAVARGIVGEVEERDAIEAFILRERDACVRRCQSEGHAIELDDAGEEFNYAIRDADATLPHIREEVCRQVLGPLHRCFEGIGKFLEGFMAERQKRLFRLAILVDQGIHPQDFYQEMQEEPEVQFELSDMFEASAASRRPFHLANRYCAPGERPLSREWMQRVVVCCREASIPLAFTERGDDAYSRSGFIGVVERQVWHRLSELPGESRPTLCLSEDDSRDVHDPDAIGGSEAVSPDPSESESGYLGLSYEPGTRSVRRFEYEHPVQLDGGVTCKLFAYLLRRRDVATRLKQFQSDWGQIGRKSNCKDNTVSAATSKLSQQLEPLGVEVGVPRTNHGWIIRVSR